MGVLIVRYQQAASAQLLIDRASTYRWIVQIVGTLDVEDPSTYRVVASKHADGCEVDDFDRVVGGDVECFELGGKLREVDERSDVRSRDPPGVLAWRCAGPIDGELDQDEVRPGAGVGVGRVDLEAGLELECRER